MVIQRRRLISAGVFIRRKIAKEKSRGKHPGRNSHEKQNFIYYLEPAAAEEPVAPEPPATGISSNRI